MSLSKGEHAFLADVLGAVHHEALSGSDAILDEEFSLEFSLREVFNEDSVFDFQRELLDQGTDNSLFITGLEVVLSNEVREVDEAHVSTLTDLLTKNGLSRALRSN